MSGEAQPQTVPTKAVANGQRLSPSDAMIAPVTIEADIIAWALQRPAWQQEVCGDWWAQKGVGTTG